MQYSIFYEREHIYLVQDVFIFFNLAHCAYAYANFKRILNFCISDSMSEDLINIELQINSLIEHHKKIQNEIVATITNTAAVLRNDFKKNSIAFENSFEAKLASWENTHAERLQTVLDNLSTPNDTIMIEIKTELEAVKQQMKNHIYWMSHDLSAEIKATYGNIAVLERSLTEKLESVTKGLEEQIKWTITENMEWMRRDCSDEVHAKMNNMEIGVLTKTLWRHKYTILFSILAIFCVLQCNVMCG